MINDILLWVILAAVLFLLWKISKSNNSSDNEVIKDRLNNLRDDMNKQMGESFKVVEKISDKQTKTIMDVTRELTELKKTGEQMLSLADQVNQLEKVLSNPKQRGAVGEYYLETILNNVLPPDIFETQYLFKNGTIVDAIIKFDKKVLPIDSKFSLDNYRKLIESSVEDKEEILKQLKNDLKCRIDETAKYVLPNENTMDFAFMFIPSETLYYDLLSNRIGAGLSTQNMIEYAFKKKVIIVSPTTLLAYLQTVIQGLRALKIEERAQSIIKDITNLHRHERQVFDYVEKVGKGLQITVNHYNSLGKNFSLLDKDLIKIIEKSDDPKTLKQAEVKVVSVPEKDDDKYIA